MKKIIIIILVTFVIWLLSCIIYIVPESHYSILDQTGKVELKDYPELKDMSFEYNADLSVEFTEPTSLELEKVNFRFNDEIIGTAEISKNINVNPIQSKAILQIIKTQYTLMIAT